VADQINRTFYRLQSHPRYALPFRDTDIVVVSDGPLDLGAPEASFHGAKTKGHALQS
jgi:hypothetical protein